MPHIQARSRLRKISTCHLQREVRHLTERLEEEKAINDQLAVEKRRLLSEIDDLNATVAEFTSAEDSTVAQAPTTPQDDADSFMEIYGDLPIVNEVSPALIEGNVTAEGILEESMIPGLSATAPGQPVSTVPWDQLFPKERVSAFDLLPWRPPTPPRPSTNNHMSFDEVLATLKGLNIG